MIIPKLTVAATLAASAAGTGCPFLANQQQQAISAGDGAKRSVPVLGRFVKPPVSRRGSQQDIRRLAEGGSYSNQRVGDGATIPEGGYAAVREDIKKLLTESQEFWPGDFVSPQGPNYGGLFIRLAWHCNGTYRTSDGRGGCDGGNIRFAPEADWPDNASLNFALELLKPIKEMYGSSLSWGDLVVLAGDTAIETMGGPVIGFCGGRIDNPDGAESLPLGPSEIQQELMPCGDQICPVGQICPGCMFPLGDAFMGLIYVNPEGPDGQKGNFAASAESIRDVFGRMGFNDRSTVAVIGGGHAFGKCHGACSSDAHDPDTGMCPGGNTWEYKFTSGLELDWTTIPTTWSNQYFNNLFDFNYTEVTSPAGALQWKPAGDNVPNIGMLTTDLALHYGDPEYEKLSREYAADIAALEKDFGEGWYQLMARDMGPRERCLGDELPPTQAWETSLGPRTSPLPDYVPVRSMIQTSIDNDSENLSDFAQLAMMCSNSFRQTDYRGGCNGARIRFAPEVEWESNAGASDTIEKLQPIKDAFPDVSWADIIILAGQTAIEAAGGNPMAFCGGRVDANNGDASIGLEPTIYNNNVDASTVYDMAQKGLSLEEGVALYATPSDGSTELSNKYFEDLKAAGGDSPLLQETLAPIVDSFIADNELFLKTYAMAWNYMATSDLFDGPTRNACQGVNNPTLEGQTEGQTAAAATAKLGLFAALATSIMAAMAAF